VAPECTNYSDRMTLAAGTSETFLFFDFRMNYVEMAERIKIVFEKLSTAPLHVLSAVITGEFKGHGFPPLKTFRK